MEKICGINCDSVSQHIDWIYKEGVWGNYGKFATTAGFSVTEETSDLLFSFTNNQTITYLLSENSIAVNAGDILFIDGITFVSSSSGRFVFGYTGTYPEMLNYPDTFFTSAACPKCRAVAVIRNDSIKIRIGYYNNFSFRATRIGIIRNAFSQ